MFFNLFFLVSTHLSKYTQGGQNIFNFSSLLEACSCRMKRVQARRYVLFWNDLVAFWSRCSPMTHRRRPSAPARFLRRESAQAHGSDLQDGRRRARRVVHWELNVGECRTVALLSSISVWIKELHWKMTERKRKALLCSCRKLNAVQWHVPSAVHVWTEGRVSGQGVLYEKCSLSLYSCFVSQWSQ